MSLIFVSGPVRAEHGGGKRAKPTPAFEGAAPTDEVDSPETPARDDDDLSGAAEAADEVAVADQSASAIQPGECSAAEVALRRIGEDAVQPLRLTDCHGEARLEALSALSALAHPTESGPGNSTRSTRAAVPRQLNPELLVRLQRIADQFPEHAIEIVSGYRPKARLSSRHRSADALDIRVDGIANAELSEFARTLPGTGVGYYPNSTFVHIDVRAQAYYWVDESGPGEAAKYEKKPAGTDAAPAAQETAPAQEPATAQEAAATQEPASAQEAAPAQEPKPGELDAELRGLAERALLVMNHALGRARGSEHVLPSRQAL